MKKKYVNLIVILSIFLMISGIFGYKRKAFAFNNENLKSKSCYLMDYNSGTVIFKNNEDLRLPIASMCKIMTLLICFDSLEKQEFSLDEKITISENASCMGGSQIFLEEGGQYLINELVKGIVVASANDACVAMAERICGSEENFVEKMNNKARELGMNNTNFVNCTGLPKPGQYSSSKDVAIMFSNLLKHNKYFDYSNIWMDKIEHPKDRITEISNTNKLIRFYEGCDGGKTGYTSEAGHCLSATASRNGMRLIAVVISAPDSKTRFKEVSDMFNFGFNNYVNKLVIDNKTPLDLVVNVKGGKKDVVKVVSDKEIFMFSKKNEQCDFEINFEPVKVAKAPIKKGDVLGKLSVFKNGLEVCSSNIVSCEEINKRDYFDVINKIILNWSIN